MATPRSTILALAGFVTLALIPSATSAAVPITSQGRQISALQTSYTVKKAAPDDQESSAPACRSAEEEAQLRKSLLLRVRYLEQNALQQRKRLDALSSELTGEAADGRPPKAPAGAGMPERVDALERGLADRTAVAEELLASARAAADEAAAELQEAEGRCAACTCDGTV
mmetsp:Transcript_40347/g.125543  ORF Transcript_40347/g.125543 Transcript_40347/m.125543 type:complete len:170 (+) Transcript_40347:72-581(+)